MRPEKIFVTSNYHPKEIFSDKSILQAICDRFNIVEIVKLKPVDDGTAVIRPPLKRAKNNITKDACIYCYMNPCGCKDDIRDDPHPQCKNWCPVGTCQCINVID